MCSSDIELYLLKKDEYKGKINKLLKEAEEIGISRDVMLEELRKGEERND